VTPEMLDTLFQQIYLERLTGSQRLSIVTMSEVVSSEVSDGEVVLTIQDHMHDRIEEMRCDVVLLGTGFEPRMPWLVRSLMDSIGVAESSVSRAYRMSTPPGITAGCYLQGVNEVTHGIADSLISVLAVRSGDIVEDILAHRDGGEAPAESEVATVSAKTGLIDGALAGASAIQGR
jgi:L-ornithine N5-oxygenase